MQMNAIFVLSLVLPATAMLRGTGDQTLVSDMRPDVVRKLLSNVEQKWIHTRAMVLSNVTNDEDSFHEMQTSCVKVATSIVEGSEGQRDRVMEYMQDVCTDSKGLCSSFASGIEAVMTDDSEFNRDELHLSQFCRKFWDGVVTSAAQAEAKEQAEKAEEERKEKEEEAKKAAEEAEKERIEQLRVQAEEEAKHKAAEQEAQEAKAYEAQQASKNQTNATSVASPSSQAQVNESTVTSTNSVADQANKSTVAAASSKANATTTSTEANITAQQASVDSTGLATEGNSTGQNTSVSAPIATENKNNTTSIAMIAHAAIKNATLQK